MRKPATGEPCAGEPHAQFGGPGRPGVFPDPYQGWIIACGISTARATGITVLASGMRPLRLFRQFYVNTMTGAPP